MKTFEDKEAEWFRDFESILCRITADRNNDGKAYMVDTMQVMLSFSRMLRDCAKAHGFSEDELSKKYDFVYINSIKLDK